MARYMDGESRKYDTDRGAELFCTIDPSSAATIYYTDRFYTDILESTYCRKVSLLTQHTYSSHSKYYHLHSQKMGTKPYVSLYVFKPTNM